MTELTVTSYHDYSKDVLSGISDITFSTATTAIFSPLQFDGIQISQNVNITGDNGPDTLIIQWPLPSVQTVDTFSAAGWTFSNFDSGVVLFDGTDDNEDIIGSSQNDSISGGGGADTLQGGAGIDTLNGGSGNDIYYLSDVHQLPGFPLRFAFDSVIEDVNGGNDAVVVQKAGIVASYALPVNIENGGVRGTDPFALYGNELDNYLGANDYGDTLAGGDGNDTLVPGLGADSLDGGPGFDSVTFKYSNPVNVNLATGNGSGGFAAGDIFTGIEGILGSPGDDTLSGDNNANVLNGLGGNDILRGRGGNDTLRCGDPGGTLNGGAGDDVLISLGGSIAGGSWKFIGGPGADSLVGTTDATDFDLADYSTSGAAVNINLAGRTGSGGDAAGDTLIGMDAVVGSAHNDTLLGDANINILKGLDGDDIVDGLAGTDSIGGGKGNDTLDGGIGDDSLFGGGDNDVLTGGPGADSLVGGNGFDSADYSGSSAAVNINLAAGSGSGGDAVGDTLIGIEKVIGSSSGDTLSGDGGANVLVGNGGGDLLDGNKGNDTLNGGGGNDSLKGGAGNDRANGGGGADRISGSGGGDTVNGNVGNDHLVGGTGADLLNGGIGGDSLFGGTGSDVLRGGAGRDKLNGGGGHDTIVGGAGNDRLVGGAMTDTFTFAGNFSHDTISDFSANNHEKIDLSGVSGITGFHNLVTHHLNAGPVADSVVIDDGAGDSIVLLGFTTDDFGAGQPISGADFIFA